VKETDDVGHCALGDKCIDVMFESFSVLCGLDEVIEGGLSVIELKPSQASSWFTVSAHDMESVSGDFDVVRGKEDFTAVVAQDRDRYDILFYCVKYISNFGCSREAAFDDVAFGV
jgi:hypothetical protein